MRHADLIELVETAHGANETVPAELAAMTVTDALVESADAILWAEAHEDAEAAEWAETGSILGSHPLLP